MRLRTAAVAAAMSLLASCSDAGDRSNRNASNGEGAEYRNDAERCRHVEDRWLMNLIARIDKALPSDATGSALFERMDAHDTLDGKGKELLLRFTATLGGQERVSMFALAPFDPQTCKVGTMKASVGRNIYEDAGKGGFTVP